MPSAVCRPDTALWNAVLDGDTIAAQRALRRGANPDAPRQFRTPISFASRKHDAAMTRLLLEHNATIGNTPGAVNALAEAARRNDRIAMALLLSRDPQDSRALAQSFHEQLSDEKKDKMFLRHALCRPMLSDVFSHMLSGNMVDDKGAERFWVAMHQWRICPQSLVALDGAFPIGMRRFSFLENAHKHGVGVDLINLAWSRGVLDEDAFFHGPHKMIDLCKAQHLVGGDSVAMILNYASQAKNGKHELSRHAQELFPYLLGWRASWPLARQLSKLADGQVESQIANARDSKGMTVLHGLFLRTANEARRMAIAEQLLDMGADPMAMNQAHEPACSNILHFSCPTEGLMKKMQALGADFSIGGAVWNAIETRKDTHWSFTKKALDKLERFWIKSTHERLDADTSQVQTEGQAGRRRL